MLSAVRQLDYAIVLCEDLDRMKAFYRDLFDFPVASESATEFHHSPPNSPTEFGNSHYRIRSPLNFRGEGNGGDKETRGKKG